jgi:hypothetical protein
MRASCQRRSCTDSSHNDILGVVHGPYETAKPTQNRHWTPRQGSVGSSGWVWGGDLRVETMVRLDDEGPFDHPIRPANPGRFFTRGLRPRKARLCRSISVS